MSAEMMPAPAVLTWAEEHASFEVIAVSAVGGGITETKWRLRLSNGEQLALRWADPRRWGEVGREHVRREASACSLLADSVSQVPRLVAADPTGEAAGGPACLMEWRRGATRLDPLSPAGVSDLARAAVAIHGQRPPPGDRPPRFSYRGPARLEVPGWSRRPELWHRAIEIRRAGEPATPHGLIHRDFHLGNLLWRGDETAAVVDWAETSWGPSDLDVAHMCADFAMLHSVAEAQTFRETYVAQGGVLDPDPYAARYWVVSDILGFLPDPAHIIPGLARLRPDVTPERVRSGIEDFLALALEHWSA
ncbi:MAG TPA: phosphotransferase [Arachnia sp.]|nr:phosphotransferase [Arachnia sp.]HMT86523.1 phosphotransferase [Arachnia sp.]